MYWYRLEHTLLSFLSWVLNLRCQFYVKSILMQCTASQNKTYQMVCVHHPGVFASFSTAHHRNVYSLCNRCFRFLFSRFNFWLLLIPCPRDLPHLPCRSLAWLKSTETTAAQTTTFVLGETSGFICVFVARN